MRWNQIESQHFQGGFLVSCPWSPNSKNGGQQLQMKSPAVTKGGRTLATKKITTKIGGYFTERLVTTHEGGTQRNFFGKVDL